MIRRTVAALILMSALGATPALGSTISLGVTSPVNAGAPFDVVVQVSNIFSGRAPGDVLAFYVYKPTVDERRLSTVRIDDP